MDNKNITQKVFQIMRATAEERPQPTPDCIKIVPDHHFDWMKHKIGRDAYEKVQKFWFPDCPKKGPITKIFDIKRSDRSYNGLTSLYDRYCPEKFQSFTEHLVWLEGFGRYNTTELSNGTCYYCEEDQEALYVMRNACLSLLKSSYFVHTRIKNDDILTLRNICCRKIHYLSKTILNNYDGVNVSETRWGFCKVLANDLRYWLRYFFKPKSKKLPFIFSPYNQRCYKVILLENIPSSYQHEDFPEDYINVGRSFVIEIKFHSALSYPMINDVYWIEKFKNKSELHSQYSFDITNYYTHRIFYSDEENLSEHYW